MDELEYAGNMNAKVNMGWTNTFRYKDFSLSFLIDAKFGGKSDRYDRSGSRRLGRVQTFR